MTPYHYTHIHTHTAAFSPQSGDDLQSAVDNCLHHAPVRNSLFLNFDFVFLRFYAVMELCTFDRVIVISRMWYREVYKYSAV